MPGPGMRRRDPDLPPLTPDQMGDPNEPRVDPDDQKAYVLNELMVKYAGQFHVADVEWYFWCACTAVVKGKNLMQRFEASREPTATKQWVQHYHAEDVEEKQQTASGSSSSGSVIASSSLFNMTPLQSLGTHGITYKEKMIGQANRKKHLVIPSKRLQK